ncbi:MAG: hypothetical protein RJB45_1831 [Pseudomonadota bacterium]
MEGRCGAQSVAIGKHMSAMHTDNGAHMAAHITWQTGVALGVHVASAHLLSHLEQRGLIDGAFGGAACFQGSVDSGFRQHPVHWDRRNALLTRGQFGWRDHMAF